MKQYFGKNRSNEDIHLFTLENDRYQIQVTDYGAALVSYRLKDRDINIVAGFDNADDYLSHTAHFGAMIGRIANRIKNSKFTLDQTTYYLSANKGSNSLHGGFNGFDKFLFQGHEQENKVIFTGISADGDEGYPGNLKITITYELLENGIRIECGGISTQKTLFGITNHSYFNLNGDGPIDSHIVSIHSSQYAPNDETGTANGKLLFVENTPFDFRKDKEIGKDLHSLDEQLLLNGGYDHHFAIEGEGLRDMAKCKANGLKLRVRSNLPGIHFYTGNFLKGDYCGPLGEVYDRHSRVCFEPEFYPNAVNYEDHKKPILQPNVHDLQIIEYLLEEADEAD